MPIPIGITVTHRYRLRFANAQHFAKVFRYRNGAMLPAGTANADNNLAFAFLPILRDQEMQHIEQFG